MARIAGGEITSIEPVRERLDHFTVKSLLMKALRNSSRACLPVAVAAGSTAGSRVRVLRTRQVRRFAPAGRHQ